MFPFTRLALNAVISSRHQNREPTRRNAMHMREKAIVVLGATGQQGHAVARALLAAGWPVRAFVRDASHPRAQSLQQQGAELVRGDLNDPASLSWAMQGTYGVFSLQTGSPEGGDIGEERRGKVVADIARATGIAHLVYSSAAGAGPNSGIAHFEIKWRVEQYIRTLGLPATILRPVFFMENFQRSARPTLVEGPLVIRQPFPPETVLQMIGWSPS